MTSIGKRKVPTEMSESVYTFLSKNGFDSAAKAFLKEASIDAKKITAASVVDLVEVFESRK